MLTSMTERYLLDTNVISATRLTREDPIVSAFLAPLRFDQLFLSVITVGELYKGYFAKNRSQPSGAAALGLWVTGVEERFSGRILPVGREIAKVWGELSSGRTRPVDDTLIAATALVHGMVVVTRNSEDFSDLPIRVIDPWFREPIAPLPGG
jgi:predicted nucleic acid-binding protein